MSKFCLGLSGVDDADATNILLSDPRRPNDHIRHEEPSRPQLWHPPGVDGGRPDRGLHIHGLDAEAESEEAPTRPSVAVCCAAAEGAEEEDVHRVTRRHFAADPYVGRFVKQWPNHPCFRPFFLPTSDAACSVGCLLTSLGRPSYEPSQRCEIHSSAVVAKTAASHTMGRSVSKAGAISAGDDTEAQS